MKPPSFQYARAESADEALALLAEHGEDARVLAGGQSLVQDLSARRTHAGVLIDLNGATELAYVRGQDGHLALGALTRTALVERDHDVAGRAPLLAEAAARVGHQAIRNRGTIGGNVANADPAANLPPALLALDAELVVRGPAGERVVPAGEFTLGAHRTALAPGELLTEVRVPALPAGTGSAFLEISRRQRGWGIAAVGAVVTLEDGVVRDARLALGCVGPMPVRAHEAEAALRGRAPDEESLRAAADAARRAVTDPPSDVHASGDFRRHLVGVLTRRALAAAVARAEGSA